MRWQFLQIEIGSVEITSGKTIASGIDHARCADRNGLHVIVEQVDFGIGNGASRCG
jgi:hypothetical protein